MSFENRVEDMEPQGDRASNERRGDTIWGMKHMREKVRDFVEEVKEKSPREAVRNITEAADHAKDQAKDYVEHTTLQGLAEDVAEVIKRFPIQSLVIGMAAGFLLSRRRGA